MLEQTKKALVYIKTFIPTFMIPEDLETIEIWDNTIKDFEMSQLDCILYWARQEKDFKFMPLDVIDKVGREYKECVDRYKQDDMPYSVDFEYTEEQKAEISNKIKKTIEAIRSHAS